MWVEPVEIFFAKVEIRDTLHHQLGHGAGRPHAVGDPDGLASPEAAHIERLADQGMPVRREREHAVDLLHQLRRLERGVELRRISHRGGEEVVAERRAGRHQAVVPARAKLLRINQDGFVPVSTDHVAAVILAEIHRAILMANDGHGLPAGLARQLGQGIGDADQVLQWLKGDWHAGHAADDRAPDAGGAEDVLRYDAAPIRLHAGDAPLLDVDAGQARAGKKSSSRLLSHTGQGFRCLDRPHGPIARYMNRAVQVIGAHDRHQAADFIGADQTGLEPPGGRVAMLAFELLPPFRSCGHLEAAHLPVDGLAVELEVAVGLHRVDREPAGGARDIVLKHQPRRVRGRTPRAEQRSLVDHDDIAPAEPGEVIGGATADDPGADDDHPGPVRQAFRPGHAGWRPCGPR